MAYLGEVHYAKGVFAGVVMDNSDAGKNNGESDSNFVLLQSAVAMINGDFKICIHFSGTVKGVEYFKCPGGSKGLVLPLADVVKI